MKRVIVHIDLNAFFASVEEIKNPHLKGKPLAVGSNGRRGVLSTANYVARKYGVSSAMSSVEALKLCPNLTIVEGNHDDYIKYSNMFFTIIEKYLGNKIEIASIDECYVDFSNYKDKCLDPIEYLKQMQKTIYNKLGLGCSIGLSYNKFLAKMASDMKKPLGFVVIRKNDIKKLIWPLDIEKMYGVGKKTAPKLKEIGINTIYDLANFNDTYLLKTILGKNYLYFINASNGIENSEVIYTNVDAKSIGNSSTFSKDLEDEDEIYLAFKEIAKSVSTRIINSNMLAFSLQITIRYNDFSTFNRSITLDKPICNLDEIYIKAINLFDLNYINKPIRLLGISLSNLKHKKDVLEQMSMFDLNVSNKSTLELVKELNTILNKDLLFIASEVSKDD